MEVMEQGRHIQEEQRTTQSCFVYLINKIRTLFSIPGSEMLFIAGLRISYVVANFIFMVLITFLTDEWQLRLFQAVVITNVQDGAKGILLIFIASLADAYLGDSKTLLLSAIIYCGGLMMLYNAYPSITDKEIKACRERNICEEKPIGILFYLALLLVTIGQCGHKNYMKSLKWEEKLEKLEKQKHEQKLKRKDGFNRKILNGIHWSNSVKNIQFQLKKKWYELTGFLIAVIVLPYVGASKHTQLLIRMCMLGVSSCIFIVGKLSLFPFEGPRGSPILEVFHVILVAFKKRRYDISGTLKYFGNDISGDDHNSNNADCEPQDNNVGAYYDNDHSHSPSDDEIDGTRKDAEVSLDDHSRYYKTRKAVGNEVAHDCSSPLTSESRNNRTSGTDVHGKPRKSEITDDLTARFGFFNKAALYNPSSENPEAEVENGRLCTVKEVEDAKCFVRASLLSLTFLTYGLIQAVSNTFFVEQANNMDRHFLKFNLPVQIFKGFSNLGEYTVNQFCHNKRKKPHQRFHGAVRIGLGMFASCFCFIAACSVESRRLQALKDNKNLTAFWILPQLILMGAMNALATSGIEDFFDHEMPDSVSISYGTILADGITGVGKLLSIALFAGVNATTKLHGHRGWFGDRINDSRLDNFYIIMIGFGFTSWIVFAMVAFLECRHKSAAPRLQHIDHGMLE